MMNEDGAPSPSAQRADMEEPSACPSGAEGTPCPQSRHKQRYIHDLRMDWLGKSPDLAIPRGSGAKKTQKSPSGRFDFWGAVRFVILEERPFGPTGDDAACAGRRVARGRGGEGTRLATTGLRPAHTRMNAAPACRSTPALMRACAARSVAERVEWAPQPETPRAEEAQAQVRRWDVSQPGGDPVGPAAGKIATQTRHRPASAPPR